MTAAAPASIGVRTAAMARNPAPEPPGSVTGPAAAMYPMPVPGEAAAPTVPSRARCRSSVASRTWSRILRYSWYSGAAQAAMGSAAPSAMVRSCSVLSGLPPSPRAAWVSAECSASSRARSNSARSSLSRY